VRTFEKGAQHAPDSGIVIHNQHFGPGFQRLASKMDNGRRNV
jgi:hypothetical protein